MDRREKATLVAECRASGMTAKAWCELKGIKYRYSITYSLVETAKAKLNEYMHLGHQRHLS